MLWRLRKALRGEKKVQTHTKVRERERVKSVEEKRRKGKVVKEIQGNRNMKRKAGGEREGREGDERRER